MAPLRDGVGTSCRAVADRAEKRHFRVPRCHPPSGLPPAALLCPQPRRASARHQPAPDTAVARHVSRREPRQISAKLSPEMLARARSANGVRGGRGARGSARAGRSPPVAAPARAPRARGGAPARARAWAADAAPAAAGEADLSFYELLGVVSGGRRWRQRCEGARRGRRPQGCFERARAARARAAAPARRRRRPAPRRPSLPRSRPTPTRARSRRPITA
jgi:hypothetical protein